MWSSHVFEKLHPFYCRQCKRTLGETTIGAAVISYSVCHDCDICYKVKDIMPKCVEWLK